MITLVLFGIIDVVALICSVVLLVLAWIRRSNTDESMKLAIIAFCISVTLSAVTIPVVHSLILILRLK